jgi:hypothetical protein
VAVIETDGTIEQGDSIKVAYDGARRRPGLTFSVTRSTPRPPGHQGAATGHRRPEPGLPSVSGGGQLRRRPVRPPLPDGQWLR